jgi:hypothetical protein
LEHEGTPFALPRSGGWLLRRRITGAADEDAAGCYPLFACRDWHGLPADLAELGDDLVSVVLVADPFGDHDEILAETFPHLRRFKEHFVVDLDPPPSPSRHHQREARRALRKLTLERCDPPLRYLDDWIDLYAGLARRHDIKGPAAFSRRSFRHQFETPGLVAWRAVEGNDTVAMALWFRQGPIAYYHLAASGPAGYDSGASYALVWSAIEHFRETGVEALDLGGAPGIDESEGHGLRLFKEGWATGSRWAYLCGRVFNEARYDALSGGRAQLLSQSGFFPAYRDPRR